MSQFDQQFLDPLSDPSRVATLVTLGFELKPSGAAVRLTDITSGPARQREELRTWTVSRFAGGTDATSVLADYNSPLPNPGAPVVSRAAICKLALHNRRCLMLQVRQQCPLFSSAWGVAGRLGNWGFDRSHQVEEVPGTEACFDTLAAAVAATVGLPCSGFVSAGGRTGWIFLPSENCAYSPAQVFALARNSDFIRENNDSLATAAAVLLNRDALTRYADQAGALNIFHHNGRYAVISAAANATTQRLAAQHLNL